MRFLWLIIVMYSTTLVRADAIREICPDTGIQPRPPVFESGGIILTSFDREAIWVYNVDRNARYPLPDTAPCGKNCHLSQDAQWITYLNFQDRTVNKMRLDGTQRTAISSNASEVEWWSADTMLVWTTGHKAYLRSENGDEFLNAEGATSIQPGGRWAVVIESQGETFHRRLVNLTTRGLSDLTGDKIDLGEEVRYFNAASWSPDGARLVFTAPVVINSDQAIIGSELYLIRPDEPQPILMTDFAAIYGAVRINGHSPGELSWSPDGSQIAFWIIPLTGPDPEQDTGEAALHILNVNTGEIRTYCGFTTIEHTPNPPRLVWSPDGAQVAFGGNVTGDDKGYLLLALNVETGVFTELSAGIYPALGSADVIAWGLAPQ